MVHRRGLRAQVLFVSHTTFSRSKVRGLLTSARVFQYCFGGFVNVGGIGYLLGARSAQEYRAGYFVYAKEAYIDGVFYLACIRLSVFDFAVLSSSRAKVCFFANSSRRDAALLDAMRAVDCKFAYLGYSRKSLLAVLSVSFM